MKMQDPSDKKHRDHYYSNKFLIQLCCANLLELKSGTDDLYVSFNFIEELACQFASADISIVSS